MYKVIAYAIVDKFHYYIYPMSMVIYLDTCPDNEDCTPFMVVFYFSVTPLSKGVLGPKTQSCSFRLMAEQV